MIVRTKRVEGSPDDIELGVRFFEDVAGRCCRETDGFLGGWFLVDRERGTTVTLTAWRDQEAFDSALALLVERINADENAATAVTRINAVPVTREAWEVAATAGSLLS